MRLWGLAIVRVGRRPADGWRRHPRYYCCYWTLETWLRPKDLGETTLREHSRERSYREHGEHRVTSCWLTMFQLTKKGDIPFEYAQVELH